MLNNVFMVLSICVSQTLIKVLSVTPTLSMKYSDRANNQKHLLRDYSPKNFKFSTLNVLTSLIFNIT